MNTLKTGLSIDSALAEISQPVLRYLERYVGDRTLAEDLQQETLLRIARGFDTFDGRSSLKTWSFSIANRVAADYFRQPERRRQIVELDEANDAIDPDREIGERVIEDEMNQCVRQVIDSLPDSYRSALILYDLEELSIEHTAEVCQCSIANAKIRIHRARLRLKEALQDQCAFYRDGEGVYRCDRKA
ncbi:RNA polymerase sigma factor [Zoogloea dura]|uniref:RNA polymerase sigma factor n=1 Tax=Zoogloea dura TaxID=2728840 RepID=A0A848G9I1_9RHOO|nr:RNA polymerase sigma factor [Zoogloea dura]NML28119.1 RNA polymerase sigma factor [Zoogloea dura]